MQYLYKKLLKLRPSMLAAVLKRLLLVRRRIVVRPEGRFFIDPVTNFGQYLLRPAGYEPTLTRSVQQLLSPGDVFLDVGANEGWFSVIGARAVGPSGLVIAIEPQSRVIQVLHRNIAENDLTNVFSVQRAISDSPGVAKLFLAPNTNTGSSGLYRGTRYWNPVESVPQTTLEALLALLRVDKIRLMKMDIEGFEYEAVLGSRGLFQSGLIEHIALELHPGLLERRGKSADEILQFLAACGYARNADFKNLVLSRGSRAAGAGGGTAVAAAA